MQDVKDILWWFKEEISSYIDFVINVENGKIPISNYSLQHKIMKATIFLMIYNMLENIIPLALKKVCDEINKKNVKYWDLIKELQQIHIQQKKVFKENDPRKIWETVNQIFGETLFLNTYNLSSPDELKLQQELQTFKKNFSINWTIRTSSLRVELEKKFAVKYGNQNFKHIDTSSSILLDRRHDLSHGIKTFNEIGRNYSIQDIEKIYEDMLSFLNILITTLDDYLENKRYLHKKDYSWIKEKLLFFFRKIFNL